MDAKTQHPTLDESAIVERIARIVFSVRGTKPDYTRLAVELEQQSVPFDVFGVVLLRHDRQAVRVIVCQRNEQSDWVSALHQHPLTDSLLEHMLQAPSLRVQEYPQGIQGSPAECGDALSKFPQLRSTLIAPLIIEDRVLGNLELGSIQPGAYDDPALQRLLGAVVRVLATAIESAQLGGNAAIQDRQREALKDVTSALTAEKDLSTILGHIVSGVANALHASSCIFLIDRQGTGLYLEAHAGLDEQVAARFSKQPQPSHEKCIVGQTVHLRQPRGSTDILHDELFSDCYNFFHDTRMRSVHCYPLITDTRVYGALVICSPESGGFTPLKTDILALFANQASIAIHNEVLFEAVHQRNRFQEVMEQFEQAHQQRILERSSTDHYQQSEQEQQHEEFELFAFVRSEIQRTFGISFSSLLNMISTNLLTQNERTLQTALYSIPAGDAFSTLKDAVASNQQSALPASDRQGPFAGALAQLEQNAESASTRAAMLGELSRLILQLKQSSTWMKDAWFVIDLHGRCTYMNPAAEAFCDLRLEALSASYTASLLTFPVTQKQGSIVPVADLFARHFQYMRNDEEVREFLANACLYTGPQDMKCVLASHPLTTDEGGSIAGRKDKDITVLDHHYQLTTYPLFMEPGGQPGAYALRIQNVTEQVRDERNRSALLASVSHDLRTPLTTIKAAVTGLLQTDLVWDERDRQEMLEDINSEADHMTSLVNALVELSRIEMGALVLFKEWCDIREIIDGVLPKVEAIIGHRTVRIHCIDNPPLISVDHVQIGRIFYNLLENAARHSPDYTEIVMYIDILNDSSEWLRVQIVDAGPGIPESERDRIFTSYSHKNYGNVLGLAICKGIIDAHQGQIWVDTTHDYESSFVFLLPIYAQLLASKKWLTAPDE